MPVKWNWGVATGGERGEMGSLYFFSTSILELFQIIQRNFGSGGKKIKIEKK